MKRVLLFVVLIGALNVCFAQTNGNYFLIIDGDSIDVALDKEYVYDHSSGEKISLKVVQSDIQTYSDEMISFQHDKRQSVSCVEIDEGISQCASINSNGSGFIIQKYTTINPSSLIDLMISEVTKESVSYGYKMTMEDFEKELVSGQTLSGKKATLTYRGDVEVYVVAGYGTRDEGILVMTMRTIDEFEEMDLKMINVFLNTLTIK